MMDWKSGNDAILEFAELIRGKKANAYTGELKKLASISVLQILSSQWWMKTIVPLLELLKARLLFATELS